MGLEKQLFAIDKILNIMYTENALQPIATNPTTVSIAKVALGC